MSEYIITIEQIKDLVIQSADEAIEGYKLGVVKQIFHYPSLPKIVRCKDCEYRYDNQCGRNLDWFDIEPDDFCAWGKRKERIEQ